MWTAVLQPEENESDLERFADAPEADPDQTGLPANGTTATAQDADGDEPPGMVPAAMAGSGHRQPAAAGGQPAEEPWPAEGAYDMSKRCVNAVLQPSWSSQTQPYTESLLRRSRVHRALCITGAGSAYGVPLLSPTTVVFLG